MSTYCECGHVLGAHADPDEGDSYGDFCLEPLCDCDSFVEVPAFELDKGYD